MDTVLSKKLDQVDVLVLEEIRFSMKGQDRGELKGEREDSESNDL